MSKKNFCPLFEIKVEPDHREAGEPEWWKISVYYRGKPFKVFPVEYGPWHSVSCRGGEIKARRKAAAILRKCERGRGRYGSLRRAIDGYRAGEAFSLFSVEARPNTEEMK